MEQKLAIEELHERLLAEGIPHDYDHHTEGNPPCWEWNSITYPSKENFVGDFVQHYHLDRTTGKRSFGTTYGADKNLMEGMGFDINLEKDGDSVRGWINVETAYRMIKKAMILER